MLCIDLPSNVAEDGAQAELSKGFVVQIAGLELNDDVRLRLKDKDCL